MTLPEVCPLDESQTCKGRECHLFCLEWRTKDPTCLIGYSTTSKIKSGKADRNRDTYAEDTFRKLGNHSSSKRKNVSDKGDWTPTRLTETPPERPVERKKESFTPSRHSQEATVQPSFTKSEEIEKGVDRNMGYNGKPSSPKPEENHDERLRGRYAANDAEKASTRVEYRLKKEPVEQNPVICAKTQPKIQERPRVPEKVISRNKHTTIFAAFDADKKDNSYLSEREENTKKSLENREKHKKLDKVKEIDFPDTYDEEFWS